MAEAKLIGGVAVDRALMDKLDDALNQAYWDYDTARDPDEVVKSLLESPGFDGYIKLREYAKWSEIKSRQIQQRKTGW